jgi:N-acetylglucosaminyldiphosphoundecaprenol N-acetyl-beta-D-mannosaminyltransferase
MNRDNKTKRVNFIDVPIDVLTMRETVQIIDQSIRSRSRLQHVVVNVAKFVMMRSNDELRRDVVESDIINVDGMGIVIAGRLLGLGKIERVAGVDLMQEVLKLCSEKNYRPYFLGAKQDVLNKAIIEIKNKFPNIKIAGYHDGYFKPDEEPKILNEIRESKADCLFIAISSPMKERFIRHYRDELGASFIMGVGGSIDVMAGLVKRAPLSMQRWGFEWLYRVWQEPRRMWKRYLVTNTIFAVILMKAVMRRIVAAGFAKEKTREKS